jgi:hypothetical protein
MRADASARRKQDNLSKQEKEVAILQKIKADWNTLRFKRKEKVHVRCWHLLSLWHVDI